MNILDKIIAEKRKKLLSKSKISVEELKNSEFLEEKLFFERIGKIQKRNYC